MPIRSIAEKTYEAKSEKFSAHYPRDQDEWRSWEEHILTAEERGPKLSGGSEDSCSIEYFNQYKKFSHLLITNPDLRREEKLKTSKPTMGEEPKADPNVVKAMGSLREMDKLQMDEDVRSLLHKAIGYLKRELSCRAPSASKDSDPNPRPQKKKKNAEPDCAKGISFIEPIRDEAPAAAGEEEEEYLPELERMRNPSREKEIRQKGK